MKLKPKDQRYKDLEKIWYDKLKQEGFQDAEDRNTGLLKEWDFNFFRNQFDPIQYSATLRYYEEARRLLLSYTFKDEGHKQVWELHCEGLSERTISSKISRYKKSMVHYIIAHIAKHIKT